jgi:hypothetical protein
MIKSLGSKVVSRISARENASWRMRRMRTAGNVMVCTRAELMG